jgi:hypothetical protein
MKKIKVLLIDPATRTVTEIEIEKGIDAIYKAMNCDMFECPVEFPNGDVMYCDEEGKLNLSKLVGGFTYSKGWHDIIMNKALVIGSTRGGNSANCKSKPADILNSKEWGEIRWSPKELAAKYINQMGF